MTVMAPKRSGKLLLQYFKHHDKDAIFPQARIGLLCFSTWKCVNQNYRKQRWENCAVGNPAFLVFKLEL